MNTVGEQFFDSNGVEIGIGDIISYETPSGVICEGLIVFDPHCSGCMRMFDKPLKEVCEKYKNIKVERRRYY